jgi:hypothetical protein
MGKKTPNTKTTAPAKLAVKPSPKVQPAKAKAVAGGAKPVKAAPALKPTATPALSNAPAFTTDDIALRAYFIAEKRRQHGLPGDEHHDWLEAERQLLAESKSAKKVRRTKARAA